MLLDEKSEMIKNIEKLLKLGVTKTSIANSMGLGKQAFHSRFNKRRFTVDQVHLFYKKYKQLM